MRATAGLGVIVGVCVATSIALAVRTPDYLAGERQLVAADGRVLRDYRPTRWNQPPARATAAWKAFTAAHPGGWHASWDTDTGVPHRLFGSGIPAPLAVGSAAHAERAAAQLLAQHIALLAPGAGVADFVLAANHRDRHLRSVGYRQHHLGMPVLGGQVSFRFVNDRAIVLASTAWPDVDAPAVADPVDGLTAALAATGWIAATYGGTPVAGTVDAPAVLPLASPGGAIEYRTVVRVDVDLARPRARWDVYVDAATGEPVARRQRLMFASATMSYNAPIRWWGAARQDYAASNAGLLIGGSEVVSDGAGNFSWAGTGNAAVTARARGPLVRVYNQAGSSATSVIDASPDASLIWNAATSELVDAQISAFVHVEQVKAWARRVSDISFLDDQLETNVNIGDTCNAFSDGTAINFYRAGGGCGNMARVADIVYHEFGHSFHNHGIISGVGDWDGHLSEGLGDFVAATLTGSPEMGIGFFASSEPLRHCDPPGSEYVWPDDVGEVHDTGRIYCGAMYDLRKNLVALLGEGAGVDLTDELFYESFRRADDIPSTYVELLAWDDDDGDLDNGTPHKCEIDDAYARHGMAEAAGESGPRVSPPIVDQLTVTLPTFSSQICTGGNIAGAMLEWRLRHDPTVTGALPMDAVSGGFQGAIPPAPWGSVVQYRVTAMPWDPLESTCRHASLSIL